MALCCRLPQRGWPGTGKSLSFVGPHKRNEVIEPWTGGHSSLLSVSGWSVHQEAAPRASRLGVFTNPLHPGEDDELRETEIAAR